jgi:hypothetical protein
LPAAANPGRGDLLDPHVQDVDELLDTIEEIAGDMETEYDVKPSNKSQTPWTRAKQTARLNEVNAAEQRTRAPKSESICFKHRDCCTNC